MEHVVVYALGQRSRAGKRALSTQLPAPRETEAGSPEKWPAGRSAATLGLNPAAPARAEPGPAKARGRGHVFLVEAARGASETRMRRSAVHR